MNNKTWTKLGLVALLSLGITANANAGSREQAQRIHERLTGVPPSATVLQDMQDMISGVQPGGATGAANLAMDNVNFYNVTLKNFAAPWTNREQNVFVPLNDYIATVIGMVRDGEDFSTLLSEDRTYVGRNGVVPTPPSTTNNQHYIELEANNINLRDELVFQSQSSVMGIPSAATAGVMTSRAASEAFFVAGTNRAMFRFTLLNRMCKDMEQMHDTKLAPDWIRQDVSRSPGGDSRLFLNNCIGCHNGMDPLAGAFAYYNFNETTGTIEYTAGVVQPKYFNNDTNFEPGYRTTDDSWLNYWRDGQNQFLGWDTSLPGSGTGAASMGQELANSDAFASCQVKKVFRAVCLREPEDSADRFQVNQMVTSFKNVSPRSGQPYNMKQTFAEAAVYCMGQ